MDIRIDHLNFRSQRKSYGISLKEIADEALLSETTVRNYEVYGGSYTNDIRTRDENEKRICNALKSLIEFRIDLAFPKALKKDDKMKTTAKKLGYDRAKVWKIIDSYLEVNGIKAAEFNKMCGITANTFNESVIKEHPSLYPSTVARICHATGWNMSKFDSCRSEIDTNQEKKTDVNKKEETVMETVKNEQPQTTHTPALSSTNLDEIRDRKFIFEDGCFFEEYTIVRRVRKSITRGAFMAAIEKEGK